MSSKLDVLDPLRIIRALITPRNRTHAFFVIFTLFYLIVFAILDGSKPSFYTPIYKLYAQIISGLLISILIWHSLLNFLEKDKQSAEEKNKKDEIKEIIEKIPQQNEEKIIFAIFIELRDRLKTEVDNLSRRANLNLIIGIITTITGVIILSTFALTINHPSIEVVASDQSVVKLDNNNMLIASLLSYLPKLTLVILIEIFAFFFLKLYRYSLSEVKFFQNELTNCEMKIIGLTFSMNKSDKHTEQVIANFLNIERNFILKKDERTTELLREEINSSLLNNLADKIISSAKAK